MSERADSKRRTEEVSRGGICPASGPHPADEEPHGAGWVGVRDLRTPQAPTTVRPQGRALTMSTIEPLPSAADDATRRRGMWSGCLCPMPMRRCCYASPVEGTFLFRSKRLLSKTETQRIQVAIGSAEAGHRGEIRVHLEARYSGDGPLGRAEELFFRLGMFKTRGGTGVLLYVAEEDRKSAVYAGPGIYGAAERGFWTDVTDLVADGYRRGDKVAGLEAALGKIGELLVTAAPGEDLAGNELPNEVTFS